MHTSGKFKWQLARRSYQNDVRARLYWAGLTWEAVPALLLSSTTPPPIPIRSCMWRARRALLKRTDVYLTGAHAKAKRGIMAGIEHRF